MPIFKNSILSLRRKVFFFLFSLFFILLKCLRPLLNVQFGVYRNFRIGSMVGDLDYLICKTIQSEEPKQRTLQFFIEEIESSKSANKFVTELWRRRGVRILKFRFVYMEVLRELARKVKKETSLNQHLIGSFFSSKVILDDRDIEGYTLKVPPLIQLNSKEIKFGSDWLASLGLNSEAKIVLVLGRDSLYGTIRGDVPHRHMIRNADINSFSQAAVALVDKGFYVFRMGSAAQNRFNVADEIKIFDYAANGMRSEFLDVFLAQRCEMIVSVSSGYDALPIAFRKPVAFVNYPTIGTAPFYLRNSLILTKKICDQSTGEELSLAEIHNRNIFFYQDQDSIEKAECELLDNSENEITNATIEAVDHLIFKKTFSPYQNELQARFKSEYTKFCYLDQHKWHGEIRGNYSISALAEGRFGINRRQR